MAQYIRDDKLEMVCGQQNVDKEYVLNLSIKHCAKRCFDWTLDQYRGRVIPKWALPYSIHEEYYFNRLIALNDLEVDPSQFRLLRRDTDAHWMHIIDAVSRHPGFIAEDCDTTQLLNHFVIASRNGLLVHAVRSGWQYDIMNILTPLITTFRRDNSHVLMDLLETPGAGATGSVDITALKVKACDCGRIDILRQLLYVDSTVTGKMLNTAIGGLNRYYHERIENRVETIRLLSTLTLAPVDWNLTSVLFEMLMPAIRIFTGTKRAPSVGDINRWIANMMVGHYDDFLVLTTYISTYMIDTPPEKYWPSLIDYLVKYTEYSVYSGAYENDEWYAQVNKIVDAIVGTVRGKDVSCLDTEQIHAVRVRAMLYAMLQDA